LLVLEWAREVPNAVVCVSAVSIFEIERGVWLVERRDPAQAMLLLRWLAFGVLANYAGRVLPVDEPIARAAAALLSPIHGRLPTPSLPRPRSFMD
jgi:predicted nucleic acid-binding protein